MLILSSCATHIVINLTLLHLSFPNLWRNITLKSLATLCWNFSIVITRKPILHVKQVGKLFVGPGPSFQIPNLISKFCKLIYRHSINISAFFPPRKKAKSLVFIKIPTLFQRVHLKLLDLMLQAWYTFQKRSWGCAFNPRPFPDYILQALANFKEKPRRILILIYGKH